MYAIIVIVIVVAGAGVAFVFLSQPTQTPEDQLIIETIGNPVSLDPHVNYETRGGAIQEQVYETLYYYPFGTADTVPSVPLLAASAPEISADGKQYNITLRQGITFHDGTPFNASVAKWNFERAVKAFRLAGPVWMIIEPILGGLALEDIAYDPDLGPASPEFAAAFDNWTANSGAIVVLDNYKIQYNLAEAFAPFIPAMTYRVGAMMSPTFVLSNPCNDSVPVGGDWREHYGNDYGEWQSVYMEDHMCGTGPYMLDEWRSGEYIHLYLYEEYWRADATEAQIRPPAYAGSIKEVWSRTNEDTTGRHLNLRTGLADIVYWPTTHADEIWDNVTLGSSDPNIDVSTGGFSFTLMAFTFLFHDLNITRGGGAPVEIQSPFTYWALRKCLTYAFDYDSAIDAIVRGWGFKAHGFIPQGMFGHNSSYWTETYDIDTAVDYWNQAMNEPGFVDIINTLDGYFELIYNSGNVIREQGSLLLKDGLQKVMDHPSANLTGITATMTNGEPGVEIRVSGMEWSNMIIRMDNHELPMWLIGWAPDYADPDNYALPFVKSTGTFMLASGYNNSVVDDLVNAGKTETDPVIRQQIYNDMQEIIAHDQPSIYMYQPSEFRVRRAWLAGSGINWSPMPSTTYYWYHIHKVYPTT